MTEPKPRLAQGDFMLGDEDWNTRPAQELPEGYRADGDIGIIRPDGNSFYMCDLEDDSAFWNLTAPDVLAIAAFLQGAR